MANDPVMNNIRFINMFHMVTEYNSCIHTMWIHFSSFSPKNHKNNMEFITLELRVLFFGVNNFFLHSNFHLKVFLYIQKFSVMCVCMCVNNNHKQIQNEKWNEWIKKKANRHIFIHFVADSAKLESKWSKEKICKRIMNRKLTMWNSMIYYKNVFDIFCVVISAHTHTHTNISREIQSKILDNRSNQKR